TYLDVATVDAGSPAHEREPADAGQPPARPLSTPVHYHGEPRCLAPLGALDAHGGAAARQIEGHSDHGADRGPHQARVSAELGVRRLAQHEVDAPLARLRLA